MNRVLYKIIAAITGVCLAVTFFAAGFAACCLPATTRIFSTTFSGGQGSPYLADDLTDLALATRHFTVDSHATSAAPGGDKGAKEQLCESILDAAANSSNDIHGKDWEWSTQARAIVENSFSSINSSETPSVEPVLALSNVSDAYALDEAAFSHLQDCNNTIQAAIPWLVLFALVAVAGCVVLNVKGRKRLLGTACRTAGAALLAIMVVLGLWATVDFDGLFAAFHGVLFPQGNWTFSARSLLICMYPEGFWVSMGALWLAVTVAACIVAMILGNRLRKKAQRDNSIEQSTEGMI